MIDVDASEFRSESQEIDAMSDGIDEFARKSGRNSHRTAIRREADRQLKETLLPSVKRNARKYVGDNADKINSVRISWRENTYSIGVGTDSVIVRSHEYGSGTHGTGAGRSGGTASGYKITARDDGPLRFDTPAGDVVTEFVIHPGVESQQFMKNTTQQKSDEILSEVLDAVMDELSDAVHTRN